MAASELVERLKDKLDPPENPFLRDPAAWVRTTTGEHLWSAQEAIMESVRDNRRTAVPASHGPGKSWVAGRLVGWWLSVHPPGSAFVVTCYTDDTEVLTKGGWKRFPDVEIGPDGDLFATRNQQTKELEWQHAYAYHEAPWDGEVVDVQSRSLHLRVTPNHRMLVKWKDHTRGTSGEILKPAEKITARGANLPALSKWKGESPGTVRFGRHEWDSVTFASFLGAWLAEGSLGPARKYVRKSNRKSPVGANPPAGAISLTQLENTKGYEPYRDLLSKMLGREPSRGTSKTWSFACSDLWHYLSHLGTAAEKHIPAEVKEWGQEELEALLHFYLLGDGWQTQPSRPGEERQWRACTVSKRLADDLQEVAQKVGMYATIKEREPRDSRIEGRDIPATNQRLAYYLCFNRAETRTVKVSRSHYTGNVHCVSVPNEVLYVRRAGSPVWCGNTAPTDKQVKAILWKEITRAHRKGGLPGDVLQNAEWKIDGELVAYGRKPADHDEHAFQGIHARYVLVILDEACGVAGQLWTAAATLMTNEDARILAIGNPDDPMSEFAAVCDGADPTEGGVSQRGWNVLPISAFATPNFTGEPVSQELRVNLTSRLWAEEFALDVGGPALVDAHRALLDRIDQGMGLEAGYLDLPDEEREVIDSSPLYVAKVLGWFPGDTADGVVLWSWLKPCTRPNPDTDSDVEGPVELGIDVGGSDSGDETVIYERIGTRVGRRWCIRSADPEKVLDVCLEAIDEAQPTAVKIDSIGIGWGIMGSLRRERPGLQVVEVNVARAASQPKRFLNLRSEMWWDVARGMSKDQAWDLSGISEESTLAELAAPQWREDKSGRIVVESKDDIRKRLGRSTDNADALLLAFYSAGVPVLHNPVKAAEERKRRRGGVADRWTRRVHGGNPQAGGRR